MSPNTDIGDGEFPALEDIEFLARSPHRITVLRALADAPRTRHDLRELADVSRITVRRLIDDLEDRGWIVAEQNQYEVTASGRLVAREFSRLHANLAVADRLDDALQWLPTEEFGFDLARLDDADVLRASSWASQTEAIRHAADLVAGSSEIRGTAIGFSHEVVETIRDLVQSGDGTFEVVIDETAYSMIQEDSGLRARFADILETEHGTLHRHTGGAPLHMVLTLDDTAVICGHVDEGPPPGTLESDDPVVIDWARTYFERARAESESVDASLLRGEPQDRA